MKTITINGITFEYKKSGKMPIESKHSYGRNIFNAYDRPSIEKVNIWSDWWFWCCQCADKTSDYFNNDMWIESRNCSMFTILGTIVNPETGELLAIKITKEHNYVWSITE